VPQAIAVLLTEPERLALECLDLTGPEASDVIVDVAFSGISTGTERLLYEGRMPPFPGLGYPLVPGYESVGEIVEAGSESGRRVGERVFVPGARCFGPVRGLFGASASRLVVPGAKALPLDASLGADGVLLALAATAQHAIAGGPLPELIVGHGVLGRLLARLVVAAGGVPTVWETNPARRDGADGYAVCAPDDDARRDYAVICDASGAPDILDTLVPRLRRGGEVVLAGFYDRLSFAFPAAFMKEARIRIAAEFREPDLHAVTALLDAERLSLAGLVTHRAAAADAPAAYRTAFADATCLKMVLDWKETA